MDITYRLILIDFIMERTLLQLIRQENKDKIILLSGPRQSGKTTLAKQLFQNFDYYNFDSSEDREKLYKKHWDRKVEAILFDEIHKMPEWKRWLKGIYDTEGNNPRIIVTGSAKFETFQKVGDSLAGRFFSYHLHPIDIKEGVKYWDQNPDNVLQRLMQCSGFPEPFLNGTAQFYRKWQRSHLDVILRQDFLDLYSVRHIKMLELLLDFLKPRIGSPASYASFSRDLQVDQKTVKSWLEMLENIYAVFKITPFHKNLARSILKEPKFYFYDIMRTQNIGARLENLVACALLKETQMLQDSQGYQTKLHYLRTKDSQEIDFCITVEDQPVIAIEVKNADDQPSPAFKVFRKLLENAEKVQLVPELKREFTTVDGIQVRNLSRFLSTFFLEDYLKK